MAEHVYENGRRYQAYSKDAYQLPNDEDEQTRLNIQHYFSKAGLHDRLFLSPLPHDKPLEVLDLGTGTGIWAKEFAELFSDAHVTGVDLSPIAGPDTPSFKSIIGDYEQDWAAFTTSQYDYIHARMLLAATRDSATLTHRAAAHLRPGGWFEWQELVLDFKCEDAGIFDMNVCRHQKLQRWRDKMIEGAAKMGIDLMQGAKLGMHFVKAGFVNVDCTIHYLPLGPWKEDAVLKRAGVFGRRNLVEGMEGISLGFLTKGLGMSKDEVDEMLAGVREELLDPDVCHSAQFYIYCGQKPPA